MSKGSSKGDALDFATRQEQDHQAEPSSNGQCGSMYRVIQLPEAS
jgi:hypothetical protein